MKVSIHVGNQGGLNAPQSGEKRIEFLNVQSFTIPCPGRRRRCTNVADGCGVGPYTTCYRPRGINDSPTVKNCKPVAPCYPNERLSCIRVRE
ncbi:hypothetical protein KM043_004053 [Ampulex compressa]|nr:hypothetical protein KM043_004053 [Ampulex compressa]